MVQCVAEAPGAPEAQPCSSFDIYLYLTFIRLETREKVGNRGVTRGRSNLVMGGIEDLIRSPMRGGVEKGRSLGRIKE